LATADPKYVILTAAVHGTVTFRLLQYRPSGYQTRNMYLVNKMESYRWLSEPRVLMMMTMMVMVMVVIWLSC